MTKSALLPLLALILLAASASAHVTTTVDAPSAPLVVGVPTNLTVHFSEPCFEVLPQEAQGQDTVKAGLGPDSPPTFNWTGETVPFTTSMCDPTAVPLALVRATATLTVTASVDAPGLTNLTLPVTSYLGGGSTPGGIVEVNVTVAPYAAGQVAILGSGSAAASGHAAHEHGTNDTAAMAGMHAFAVNVTYTSNVEGLISFEFTPSVGTVDEVAAIAVTPPSFNNKTSSSVVAAAVLEPPAEWTSANVTVKAFFTPTAGGQRIPLGTASLALDNDDAVQADHHEHDHEDSADTPAPAFAWLVGALAVALVVRRRK